MSKYKTSYWKKNCRFFSSIENQKDEIVIDAFDIFIHFYIDITSCTSLLSSIDLIDYLFLLMATNSYDQGISLNHVSDHT
jgi:hypothetical protein